MNDIQTLLATLGHPRVLVIGDLILDRYTWGDAERISPEAPVPVLRADLHEVRPGGAASVAILLRALEAKVHLAGIRGNDADGRVLAHLLDEAGVESTAVLLDPDRPTTAKERFLGRAAARHPQQILRVDRESREPLLPEAVARLVSVLSDQVQAVQAVLISDYGKGVCTPELLAAVRVCADRHGVPLLVDPARLSDYERYRGATLLKPNRVEAELAIGQQICSPGDALAAARELCARYALGAALVTLDRDGMALVEQSGHEECFPTRCREVYDITGAGDMVLAIVGLCSAAGCPLPAAAQLANVAAGLEVERLGVAPLNRAELAAALRPAITPGFDKQVSVDRLSLLAEQYRCQGQRIVFTNGCFDLLHAGHLACLEEAARLGDVLVVAVNSDASVRRLKGPTRPVVREDERLALVAALGCVDHVVILEDDTPHNLLHVLQPNVLVKGGTYGPDEVVGHEIVTAYGGQVCVTGMIPGRSTSGLLEGLRNGPACRNAVASSHNRS